MKLSQLFIRDPRTFEEAHNAAAEVFALDLRLPEQVFRSSYTWFAFDEFLWTLSADFWSTIQELSAKSGDTSLTMAVLDPDPRRHSIKELGHYNWADMSVQISNDDYWDLLNEHPLDNSADCLLFNSETVAWFPRSAEWAIWGERVYGICVLGCRKSTTVNEWRDLTWALADGLPNNFGDLRLLRDFQNNLKKNYES
ncbi:MAG: hypothetical protein AB7S92_24735 [Parvibaculaceae bacterium]